MEELIPLSAIGAAPTAAPSASLMDSMDSQAFLNLFVAQLKYQNPLEPSGGTEMMLQTAQFSQVEMLQRMLETQQDMIGMSQVAAATGMVGTEVTGLTADGTAVTGVVDGYLSHIDGPVLLIGNEQVSIDAVTEVRRPDTT